MAVLLVATSPRMVLDRKYSGYPMQIHYQGTYSVQYHGRNDRRRESTPARETHKLARQWVLPIPPNPEDGRGVTRLTNTHPKDIVFVGMYLQDSGGFIQIYP